MYLTVWTAILLSVREPLMASFPEFVLLLVWASGISSALLTISVYGLALLMDEGLPKDKLVRRTLYFLCADMLVFFVFTVLGKRI